MLDLFGTHSNVQRLNVLLELFNFLATNNWEYIGELLQVVRDCNCLSASVSLCPYCGCNM
jgi:hypothetical protein